MPTVTHTLEGPDLEALLARVPAELGPDATIVAANKLRTGGLGGFFAKELFEVVVEVPEVETPEVQPAPAAAPRRAAPSAAAPSAPRVSTEAIGFAGVLDRMVRDAGAEDSGPRTVGPAFDRAPAPPAPAAADDDAELPFEPMFPARTERPLAPVAMTTPGFAPAGAAPGLAGAGPAGAGSAPAGPWAGEPLAGQPFADQVAHQVAGQPAGGRVASEPLACSPAAARQPGSALVAAPAPSIAAVATASGPTLAIPSGPSLDQRWLARVGIPTNVAAHLTTVSEDPTVELLHLMEQLAVPEPLPAGPGAVIAVVGRRADALEIAEAFAAELGTSPDDILVAATTFRGAAVGEERRLSSIDLALERRRSWRRRRQPTIVAVDASLGRPRSTWATHLLDAVEPTMVWGVVEASRKAEDIRDWAERLGGLDALAVTGLDDTVSPASVLGAGVPVGLLDGHEATASRWTAILSEHLEVAA